MVYLALATVISTIAHRNLLFAEGRCACKGNDYRVNPEMADKNPENGTVTWPLSGGKGHCEGKSENEMIKGDITKIELWTKISLEKKYPKTINKKLDDLTPVSKNNRFFVSLTDPKNGRFRPRIGLFGRFPMEI